MEEPLLRAGARQQGAVLLTGLVLLFVITVLGVSGMQSVTLDERIISNMQSASLAFHGAEAALSNCEANVQAQLGSVALPRVRWRVLVSMAERMIGLPGCRAAAGHPLGDGGRRPRRHGADDQSQQQAERAQQRRHPRPGGGSREADLQETFGYQLHIYMLPTYFIGSHISGKHPTPVA